MALDLKAFRYFAAIANAGSFSRAADLLHIAQPALSVQVRNIEEEFGVQLFLRTRKGVVLTPAGERFLLSVNDVLRLFEAACEGAKRGAPEPAGEVSLGLPQSLAKRLTVPVLKESLARWPKIRLKIVEMNTGYITGFLNSGVIDLGFMFMADTPGFHFRHLVTERLCVVGPSGAFGAGPSARLGSMPLKDVEGLELILPTTLHSLRQLLEDYARRYRLKLNVLAEVNSVQQLIDVVREGIGYTILSYPSIRDELMAGFVSGAMIDSPSIARPAYLCRSALVAPTRAATEVEALIVDVARDLVLKGHWTAKLAPELAGS